MSAFVPVNVSDDQVRAIVLDWLIPFTEDGTVDELWQAFTGELANIARQQAIRLLNRKFPQPSGEVVVVKLRAFLAGMNETLEEITLNPDMMAVAGSPLQLDQAALELKDWIRYLDNRPDLASEAVVHPTAAQVMSRGGVL